MLRRIFSGGSGTTVDHPYPVIAVDHAGGVHVAFSDGMTVFLMSSADGGGTWKNPVPVNNPEDLDTSPATAPWVFAGDSGRVGILWVGSRGETDYALTPDAFAPVPTFAYVRIGESQANTNLPSAVADAFGNANIVYGHTQFSRQVAGDGLIFSPFMISVGSIKTETGVKRVSFSVRQDFSGNLTYLDEQRRISLRSTHFTSSKRSDQKFSITGRGTLQDESEVSFTLVAPEPSTKERSFSIAMSNGYFAGGVFQNSAPTVMMHR